MYDPPMPYVYQDFPITEDSVFIMTDAEIEELTDLQDAIYDIVGDYPHFVSLDDARQFYDSLEYLIETEGYSPGHAYDSVVTEMGL
jgi:hypothetical protein